MFPEIIDFFHKRAERAKLQEELSRMNDRELADIGLKRSDIPSIIKEI
jgi:uncharacterized protein YjiS (DUF1127 family)